MAENYLITGYHGTPHVTAENDRGIHAAIFGAGRFVLPVGQRFKAEYIGNNTIRLYDGKLMDNGAAAGIPAGEYVDLTISNAGQGMKRNDLIVFQYSQDTSTLIETGEFVVVQGTETNGTAADPTLSQADLLEGTATLDQMALWRVAVSGATISAPVQVFELSKAIPELKQTYTKSDVGLGNVDNIRQYSASNPPPYPVTSVNGKTGDVQETDPTVPTWAKAETKPAYTATEVGALPTTGGTLTGGLTLSDGSNHVPLRLRRTVGENLYTIDIYPGTTTGSAMFILTRDGVTQNALILGADSTTLNVPLNITSGGTGATNRADALKNLGIFIQAEKPDYVEGGLWIKLAE